ncbi:MULTISPECIES: hypothetical protein [Cupriavidus]|uniref:hypothetical protein n=1 Tax=Cupriavidus TaxID=106589 RepID=UPI00036EE78C|nr:MULTISPECIES: hypothetical protein [Cupriavidus]
MLLLTVEEWLATRTEPHIDTFVSSRTRLAAYATRLELGDALRLLKRYSDVYKQKYSMTAVAFRLVSVAQIADDTDEQALRDLDVQLVTRDFADRLADA